MYNRKQKNKTHNIYIDVLIWFIFNYFAVLDKNRKHAREMWRGTHICVTYSNTRNSANLESDYDIERWVLCSFSCWVGDKSLKYDNCIQSHS